jgi:hypothetical protein
VSPSGFGSTCSSTSRYGLEYLIAIGGDDTLSYAAELDRKGMKVLAVPKTIDNDVQQGSAPHPIVRRLFMIKMATRNGFIRTENYRTCLKTLETKLCLPKLNLQVLRRTIATLAQTKGKHQGRAGHHGTQQGRHHGERLYAGNRGQRETDAGGDLFRADGTAESRGSVSNARNLVRFFVAVQMIGVEGLGA